MGVGNGEFKGLVDELEDLELRRTGSGGFANAEEGARRQQVERRLIELITTILPTDQRRNHVRVPCELGVAVRIGQNQSPGIIVDVGAGGVFVATRLLAAVGDDIDVEIARRAGSMEHSLHVRGKVAWVAGAAATREGERAGLGIAFSAPDEPAERRVRRFVIELLRQRGH